MGGWKDESTFHCWMPIKALFLGNSCEQFITENNSAIEYKQLFHTSGLMLNWCVNLCLR